jgi:hypothetical protein
MKMMLAGMARKLRDKAQRKLPDPPKKPRLSDETASKVLALHIEQATYGKWK